MALFKWKIGSLEFAPSATGTLITLLLITLFVKLGFWQLGRMQEKKLATKNLEARMQSDVIDFSAEEGEMINRDFETFRFYFLKVTGKFLEDRDFLLDNQIVNGQPGYRVITPFLSASSNTLILVDRGWIPWGETRNQLPPIPTLQGTVTLKGIINKLQTGLKLSEPDGGIETPTQQAERQNETGAAQNLWPLRIQSVDYQALSSQLKQPVFHFILKLPQESPYTFKVEPIHFGISSDRHLGYALQWFTMALATFIYYGVINLRRWKH